jgi:hypothetical protein
MRCTQFIGLTEKAKRWLQKHCRKIEYVETTTRDYLDKDGNVIKHEILPKVKRSILDSEDTPNVLKGMFDEDSHILKQYFMHNGSTVEEFLQAEPWSSGPMQFLALRFRDTKSVIHASLWTDKEMGIWL